MMLAIDHHRRSKGIDAPITLYGPVGLHDLLGQIFFRTRSMPKFQVFEMSTMASDAGGSSGGGAPAGSYRMKKHDKVLGPADRVICEGVSCYRLYDLMLIAMLLLMYAQRECR